MDFSDSSAVLSAAQTAHVRLVPPCVVLLNEEDVSGLIRQIRDASQAACHW